MQIYIYKADLLVKEKFFLKKRKMWQLLGSAEIQRHRNEEIQQDSNDKNIVIISPG